MEKEYIKYSIRHGIKDPDLAGLLDYLERVAGWDIEIINDPDIFGFSIFAKGWRLHIDDEASGKMSLLYSEKTGSGTRFEIFIDSLRTDIFYRTYKSLIPAARDVKGK